MKTKFIPCLTAALCAMPLASAHLALKEVPQQSLALEKDGKLVWQFHFGKEDPKPFFHPLRTVDGHDLTWLRPDDHPWHLGLWFSWKFINGKNYWESDRTTGKSEGVTEVTQSKVSVTLFEHPAGFRHPTPWYVYFGGKFGAIKSAPIYAETITLEAGKSFELAYRVFIHPGMGEAAALDAEYQRFSSDPKPASK